MRNPGGPRPRRQGGSESLLHELIALCSIIFFMSLDHDTAQRAACRGGEMSAVAAEVRHQRDIKIENRATVLANFGNYGFSLQKLAYPRTQEKKIFLYTLGFEMNY